MQTGILGVGVTKKWKPPKMNVLREKPSVKSAADPFGKQTLETLSSVIDIQAVWIAEDGEVQPQ